MIERIMDVAKIKKLENSMRDSSLKDLYHQKLDQKFLPGVANLNINQFIKAYTHLGDTTTGVSDVLRGISQGINGIPSGVAKTANFKSKVFVVRPQLNLSSENLAQDRHLSDLLTDESESMARYVRMMLDPRLGASYQGDRYTGDGGENILRSQIVDNTSPFIPVLTNTLEAISGWPESVSKTHTSTPGLMGEESIMVDGTSTFRGRFELDLSFRKITTDPILKLFNIWMKYPGLTYGGLALPYYDFVRADEYDYNTRIYQLLLSEDGRYVKKIASTGASFPISLPDGSEFNIGNDGGPFEAVDDQHTIRFASVGAIYNDPITILNFNIVSTYFSHDMKLLNAGSSGHSLIPVPADLAKVMNHRAYPRINMQTMELEWWIHKVTARDILENMNSSHGRIITTRTRMPTSVPGKSNSADNKKL